MFKEYCVIFDMDGVLADTGPMHFESWLKIANEIGVKYTREYFEKTFGQQSVPIVRELVGPDVKQEDVENWANLKEQYYREMVKDKLKPLPGAISLIKELKKKGFKLAVGSSGPPENVDLLLRSLKIKKYFDTIITAVEIEEGKPAPDVFLLAAKRSKIPPINCIVLEDAPVGIEAARRAGMKVIALTTTHEKEEIFDADIIVKDLSCIKINDIFALLNINV